MKIQVHENTNLAYLTTEPADDQFLLGRLAERLGRDAQVYPQNEGQRQLTVDVRRLIRLAAGVA